MKRVLLVLFCLLNLVVVASAANVSPAISSTSGNSNESYSNDNNLSTYATLTGAGSVTYSLPQNSSQVIVYVEAVLGTNTVYSITTDVGTVVATATTSGSKVQSYTYNLPANSTKMTIKSLASANGTNSVWLYEVYVVVVDKPPSNLAVGTTTTNSVALSWTGTAGATSYKVYENGTLLKSGVTGTSYTATSLSAGTTYNFYVTAVTSNGETAASNTVTATTQTPPAMPGGLKVVSVTSGSVSLAWDNSTSATGYNVYKNGVLVNQSPYPTNNYTVTGLEASTSYDFQVTAVNSNGESAKSNVVTAKTQDTPPFTLAAPTDARIATDGKITWTNVDSNPVGTTYSVFKNGVLLSTASSPPIQDASFSPYANYTISATYNKTSTSPNPVAGSGIVNTGAEKWGFQASDVWSNSVNLVVSIGGFLLLILAVVFATDLRRIVSVIFGRVRERVKL